MEREFEQAAGAPVRQGHPLRTLPAPPPPLAEQGPEGWREEGTFTSGDLAGLPCARSPRIRPANLHGPSTQTPRVPGSGLFPVNAESKSNARRGH